MKNLPLPEMHMVVSCQTPHQPYKGKLIHRLPPHENGNFKTNKAVANQFNIKQLIIKGLNIK